MDTLDLLQEVIADFAGTLLLVSHDRDFRRRATRRPTPPAHRLHRRAERC
jgi:ATP-binding cassette subfamily F protein uup